MGYGVYLIEDKKQFRSYCDTNEILYIQEKLPIVRDMRIVYVGDEVIASYWRIGVRFYHHL
jgi:ribosomal protein S6--L-glutamate ligase